jgi:hypothetical protein
MSRIKSAMLGLGLASVLAVGTSAIVTASATADRLFAFCQNTGANEGYFASNICSANAQGTGWILLWAASATTAYACVSPGGNTNAYTNLYCNVLSAGGNTGAWARQLQDIATPALVGTAVDGGTLKGTVASLNISIGCKTGRFSGQPESSGKISKGELIYESCTVKPATCTVREPIVAAFNGQLLETEKVLFEGDKAGTSKEVFTEVDFESAGCALKGVDMAVKGQQLCENGAGTSSLKESQKLICRASESSLKIGSEKASYEGEISVETTNKSFFDVLDITI